METAAENDASLDEAPSLGPDASVADTHDSGDGHEHNAAAFFEEADEAEGLIRGLVEKLREGSGPRAGPDAYCRVDRDAAAESSENPWCRTTPEEEAACVRIKRIFLKYQEQPHLLDPFLSRMITPTVTCLRDVILEAYEMDVSNSDSGEVSGWPQMTALVENARVHQLLEVLYGICSVRGSKTTVRLFTNSPAELTPLLAFLSLIPRPSVDYRPWASRFVVLLWLSLVVMVPFDLRTIDSSAALTVEGDEGRPGLLRQIIESCKNMFAQATGKDGEAAGILLARLLGRSDALEDDELNAFLSWAARDVFGPNHEPDTANVHLAKNTLYALCLLLKYSLRSHLLPCLDALSSVLFTMVPNEEETTGSSKTGGALRTQVLQKLLVKYAGRLGELLMPPRNRDLPRSGITALQDNLRGNSQSTCREGARPDPHAADNDGDESDVPEAMEPLLSFLLSELSAPSSAVRWVAAKALSRICSRLPRAFAAEVVEAAIGGFSENVLPNGASPDAADLSQCSDATWHGTLLLLAALIRAHALSRPLISACVPWVLRALTFDHKRGSQIMGIGVRDAACYVLWALARSNPGDIERLDTQSIGRHLVCTAMFDREVNVRRAASAAFQEGVGRFRDDQRYSNGIDVLRALDFWTIGNVRKCYRTVAVAVAAHEAYLPAILAHLTKHCIGHWDIQLRILASLALEGLAETSLAPVIDYSWTMLIDRTKDLDSAKVHGAVLAVAELCLAAGKSASPAGAEKLDLLESCRATTIVSQAATILGGARMAILEQATPTSDMLLAAYVRLVECLSLSRASLDGNGVAAAFCILELALSRKLESLQRSAARAYGALVYLVPETLDRTRVDELLRGVVPTEDAAGLSFFRRRGCAMVLGQLPSAHVLVSAVAISRSLRLGMQKAPSKRGSRTVYIRSTVTGEAEAKCECVASLVRTCVVVLEATFAGGARPEDVAVVVGETLSALTRGMLDYSVDSRGDVGSWVREASMRGFGTLLPALLLVHSQAPISSFEDYKVTDIFGGILQQSVEKIDRVRTCAGSTLRALLSERRCLNAIEDAEALKDVLLAEPGVRWNYASDVFPRLMPLLHLRPYRGSILRGIVTSIGGMTDSLVKSASAGLVGFLETLDVFQDGYGTAAAGATLTEILADLLSMIRTSATLERIVIALLQTYHVLLSSGLFRKIPAVVADPHHTEVLQFAEREASKSRDPKKLMGCATVAIGFLGLVPVGRGVGAKEPVGHWTQLAIDLCLRFLLHPFPRVRKHAAEQLYLVLSARDLELQLGEEDVEMLLSDDETTPQNDSANSQGQDLDSRTLSCFAEKIEPLLLGTDWDSDTDVLRTIVDCSLTPAVKEFLGLD